MTPDPAFYADAAFALPAFRIFACSKTDLCEPSMRQAAAEILDIFLEVCGPSVDFVAKSGGRIKSLRPEKLSDKTLKSAKAFIAEADWSWPSTLRFNGWPGAPLNVVTPPHLRIEQAAGYAVFQLEFPPDMDGLVEISDRIEAVLVKLDIIYGYCGFGLYLPAVKDSLISQLPAIFQQYRCAIEVQPDHILMGLQRIESAAFYRKFPAVKTGIPDIGWRTILGKEFSAKLPSLESALTHPETDIRRYGDITVITAGRAPIWGDLNRGDDITPYRNVAQALDELRLGREYLLRWLFGGNEDFEESIEWLDAWAVRFKV